MKPFLAVALALAFRSAATAAATDLAELVRGVREIRTAGVPGGVCAFGPEAFAVVAGKDGGDALLPVVAAARWKTGRIVAFGHDGFLTPADDETAAFLVNSARWAAGGNPKIGVVANPALSDRLRAAGQDAVDLDRAGWTGKVHGLGAVCAASLQLDAAEMAAMEKYLRDGGGLVTGVTGWGWLQIHRKEDRQLATDYSGNVLLARAGLVFTAGTPGRTLADGYATGGDLKLLNASAALRALEAKEKLTAAELAQCSATLGDAIRSLPPGDEILRPQIASLADQPLRMPTPDKPLHAADALDRLLVTLDSELRREVPNPGAAIFPGAVPENAPRVSSRVVAIDTAVPQWHGTGLYAAPGETIRVTIPAAAADQGLGVRIGCHTDRLWQLDTWKRAPEISRREPLKSAVTEAANPFGGLVYIDVPGNCALGKIGVTISGAVEAPRFVLGEISDAEWKNGLRDKPAPWAELETAKVILSVPSEKIRRLENPEELMKLWDSILDAEADLSTIPHERMRPERIVPDVQISAGYMHSGYPIMTQLDRSVELSLSTEELAKGSWGHFHELGHNHQQADWTFAGTTEVTCNLYSLYVMETVCGRAPGTGHEAMEPAQVAKRLQGYPRLDDKFGRWKSDPFLALTMYDQLRAGFGWETYKKVFAEYRALPASARPKNDAEKRDQWLVRFSRAAGKNLGPFFEAWGVPTSAAARGSVADLPPWMPGQNGR